ncbi:MAG: CHRD domain-containing protein [Oscillatoriophycideae cyanobacterium NC_groundwater_1537_Pr4_S-0.65um_50_18]|nr:CHRD domain-containing protein [Oscillatoriophycideae cyanobacterium NC_groundwater_1537_Pr4_S-0.65um_50_18]
MGLDHKGQQHNEDFSAGALVDPSTKTNASESRSKGSSILDSNFAAALDDKLGSALASGQAVKAGNAKRTGVAFDEAGDKIDNHNHGGSQAGGPRRSSSINGDNRVSLNRLKGGVSYDSDTIEHTSASRLANRARFSKGDLIDTGAGVKDVAIGAKGSDVFFGDKGGTNTFTTGTGQDAIILGKQTTNRIFDFDASKDKLVLGNGLTMNDVTIVQGNNPGKGGINQPLDSVNNALVVSKADGQILASLTFAKAANLNANSFRTISDVEMTALRKENIAGFNLQKGAGTISSDQGSNNIQGSSGDDFVRLGGDQVKFKSMFTSGGQDEFPFPNPSPGSSQINIELKGGRLLLNGNYNNFEAAPLFSQGETAIDPNAIILNGSDPVALINGFLATPQDEEGNKITGTHIHFSPAGDDRGNFADATIVRYIQNNVTSAKAGNVTGAFNLKAEEEAALIAGNLYFNLHTNVDLDKDGKAGFPTGENRLNANRNIVQFV